MPMTREDKQAQAASVRETWNKANSVVLLDFSGVDVDTITSLRAEFRKVGVEYKVVKNNVVKKALDGTAIVGNKQFLNHLKGPTAFAWSFEDASVAAKTILKFREDNAAKLSPKNLPEKLVIKCGLLDGEVMDRAAVENTLSKLPGKNEIRAMLLATMMAPAQNLVAQLNAPAQRMALVLDAKLRKEGEG